MKFTAMTMVVYCEWSGEAVGWGLAGLLAACWGAGGCSVGVLGELLLC